MSLTFITTCAHCPQKFTTPGFGDLLGTDSAVEFCLVQVGFDPLSKIFEDIGNAKFWNRKKPTQEPML